MSLLHGMQTVDETRGRELLASAALTEWQSAGLSRLSELEKIHRKATGPKPGRRWETTQLNRSLFVALVAQFQTYCRGLHDQAVDVHLAQANSRQVGLLRTLMTRGRRLDTQTPRTDHLGADFSKLGFSIAEAVKDEGPAAEKALRRLDLLVDFRNAIGHGNETEITSLVATGEIRATKKTYRSYRRTLERLASIMDRVVAERLATGMDIPLPW